MTANGAAPFKRLGATWCCYLTISYFTFVLNIPGTVYAVLADAHGDHNDVAIAECMALCYAFAILAPLTTSLCIGLSLGWRVALLFGVALGLAIMVAFAGTPFPLERRPQSRTA